MSAVKAFERVRPIARWDLEPSEFWEALTRIEAELRYNPRTHACRWPEPHGPVRHMVTGASFSGAAKERLRQLVSQLPWLLPTLEHLLATSRTEGLARIDHYRRVFHDASNLIDLKQFAIDEYVDLETLSQQIDALSRAMLLKSELILIIAQFDLLREAQRERERAAHTSNTRLKVVA